MTGCGFESSDSALECLVSLSEEVRNEENEFDDQIVTSGWDEVSCGWRNTKPNARYAIYPERRKRSKEKLQISPEPDSQLAKVKKLAGMIAHSNRENNNTTKLKSARDSALIKYQNCDVLSYDTPCWRFVVDPKSFVYIDRPTFLERRSAIERKTTTHTIILENGGMITCEELNGRMVLFDPAYYFDKHLLGAYIEREEFRLRACKRRPVNGSFDYKTSFSQTLTDENKICVVQTVTIKPTLEPCSSVCEMCRHRTQELNDKCIGKSNSNSDLKPLVKVTPTQRKIADDSRLAGKVLIHQAKGKDINLKSLKVSKKSKDSIQARHVGMRLDWLPITLSTIAYPCDTTGSERVSNDKFPGRTSQAKAFAFPRHGPKARKLTLSEAANLVPRTSKLGHAIDKLTKDLENKQEKPITLTEPVLPSVSGTKLEMPLSSAYCNM